MNLNDLLRGKGIDPETVLVMRHRPSEPELNRVLPWLASERPDLFNAYQQTQGDRAERAIEKAKYIVSCIAWGSGRALFVGLYSVDGWKKTTFQKCARMPVNRELTKLGAKGFTGEMGIRPSLLWFDLQLTDFYAHWKGKLIVDWPPPGRVWLRRSHRNNMPIHSILDESALGESMPKWDEIVLTWEQLSVLPTNWKAKLSEWRAIYYIFDRSDGKGYVGAAYGESNVLGRWLNYAAKGDGGNRLLKQRNPKNFEFSILQRESPDMEAADMIRLESTWKERLHTRHPYGLNDN